VARPTTRKNPTSAGHCGWRKSIVTYGAAWARFGRMFSGDLEGHAPPWPYMAPLLEGHAPSWPYMASLLEGHAPPWPYMASLLEDRAPPWPYMASLLEDRAPPWPYMASLLEGHAPSWPYMASLLEGHAPSWPCSALVIGWPSTEAQRKRPQRVPPIPLQPLLGCGRRPR